MLTPDEYPQEAWDNPSMLDARGGVGPYTVEDIKRIERAAVVHRIARKRDRPKAHPLLRHHLRNLLGRWVIPLSITYLGVLGFLVWWLFQIAGRKP